MNEFSLLSEIVLILLFVAIGIFGSLAIQSKSVKSFQFQVSLIIIIWILGEIVEISHDVGLISLEKFDSLPSLIHMSAMLLIGIVFWLRYYFAKRQGKRVVDDLYD